MTVILVKRRLHCRTRT